MTHLHSDKRELRLVAAGFDTTLASRLIAAGFTLAKLKTSTKSDLSHLFTSAEVNQILDTAKRKPIPDETVRRLVRSCDWKCCMCGDYRKESPVILHHIVEHAKTRDDSYNNLVVLCLDHHAKAHSRWDISRSPYSADVIRNKKRDWVKALKEFKAGKRPAPGNEPPLPVVILATAPKPPHPFIARDPEYQLITSHLATGTAILLHGMGGVGKSALAKHVAATQKATYPGGVFWGDLAIHNGSALSIMRIWLRSCSVTLENDADINTATYLLRGALTSQREIHGSQLVVIDNACWEWIDDLKAILSAVPSSVPILVTGQDQTIAGAIGALAIGLGSMKSSQSMDLMQAIAGADLISEDVQDAREIVEMTGGLPLAVELAARQIGMMARKPGFDLGSFRNSLKEHIFERLKVRGRISLDGVFELTYKSLSIDLQRLFRCVAIFQSGLLVAKHVASIYDTNINTATGLLDDLVSVSVLAWADRTGAYTVHALLHEYAGTQLYAVQNKTEADAIRLRHLDFFLQLCLENSAETREAHMILEENLPDVTAAFDLAVASQSHEKVVSFAKVLWTDSRFLQTRGQLNLAKHILKNAVTSSRSLVDPDVVNIYVGQLGTIFDLQGDLEAALDCYNEALTICRKIGDRHNECAHLGNLGMTRQQMGDSELAASYYQAALTIALEIGNGPCALDQLNNLGSVYRRTDADKTRRYYSEGLRLARQYQDRGDEGNFLSNLGLLEYDAGNYDQAQKLISDALDISRQLGDLKSEANRLGHLGNICLAQNKSEKAKDFITRAVDIAGKCGYRSLESAWLAQLGAVHWSLGEVKEASKLYQQVLLTAQEIGHVEHHALCLVNLGILHQEEGDHVSAINYLTQAVALTRKRQSTDPAAHKKCLSALVSSTAELGDIPISLQYLEESLTFSRAADDADKYVDALNSAAVQFSWLGQRKRSVECLTEVIDVQRRNGTNQQLANALLNLGITYNNQGDGRQALGPLQEALGLCRHDDDRYGEGLVLGNLGNCYLVLGEPMEALPYHNQALSISRDLNDRIGAGNWLGALGHGYLLMEDYNHSATLTLQALEHAEACNDEVLKSRLLEGLGSIYYKKEEFTQSIEHLSAALELGTRHGNRSLIATASYNLAQTYQEIGDNANAITHLELSLIRSRELGHRKLEAAVSNALGELLADGDPKRALDLFDAAIAYYREFDPTKVDEVIALCDTIRSRLSMSKA